MTGGLGGGSQDPPLATPMHELHGQTMNKTPELRLTAHKLPLYLYTMQSEMKNEGKTDFNSRQTQVTSH